MTFTGAVFVVALCLLMILGLVVAWLWQDRKDRKAELASVTRERDAFSSEVNRLREQASKFQKIEEVRNAQKDAVSAGGFAASVSVLSDIAARTKPKT